MLAKTPYRMAEELAYTAWFQGHMTGCADAVLYQMYLHKNCALPEKCLPGRLIMRLSQQERELIKQLKAEHFNNRIY